MIRLKYILTLVLIFIAGTILAGPAGEKRILEWKPVQKFSLTDQYSIYQLYFIGSSQQKGYHGIPLYSEKIPIGISNAILKATLIDPQYEQISDPDLDKVKGLDQITDRIVIKAVVAYDHKIPFAQITFVPLRRNPANGKIEKLVSFRIDLEVQEDYSSVPMKSWAYKQTSVLASGDWYKIAVNRNGVHKMTYTDMANMGIPVSNIDPGNIRIYGNGGGMLPEKVADFRYDDLIENAIMVVGGQDGSFDAGDYVLFYGEEAHKWNYNPVSQRFHHTVNIYSEYAYYFITADLGPGKRISNQSSSGAAATHQVNKFVDYANYEKELVNIVKTGRSWYDYPPYNDIKLSYDYSFSFPNIDLNAPVYIRTSVAARSFTSSSYRYYNNGSLIMTVPVSKVPNSPFAAYASSTTQDDTFNATGASINLRVEYTRTSSGAQGWMDFIELNATRLLKFTGTQMHFRDPYSVSPGNISAYELDNANASVKIWNVTDPVNVSVVGTSLQGSTLTFKLPADSLLEFVALDGSAYFAPFFIKRIDNQNLHSLLAYEMIIISHPSFLSEANRLADQHIQKDGLSVFVVENEKVYNEFSSGAQDITAIRDFMKMLYERETPGKNLKYLLLFGDASYDYKDREENNTNFVPTWEDKQSLHLVSSVVTDDYYGFLDDHEGTGGSNELLDIGVGRLPVGSVEQAHAMVNKIIHYATNTPTVMGSWRNMICFVADDEDQNTHMQNHAERMAKMIDTTYKNYNIDKIYLDAYTQQSTPGGQRAPDVNAAINNRMEKGTMAMNYTGHGGEVGWGHERILEISDINSWGNYDKLPIFITATCEFSRYDDPERTSAGELVFLNPDGGAVGMFTTARATYGSNNFNLNMAMYECMFEKVNGEYPRYGDMIRLAKNKDGSVSDNDRKFVLLGDPALSLPYPDFKAVTNSVNSVVVNPVADTLKALQEVTITGEIQDETGNLAQQFNGLMYPIVFDKPNKVTTLGADPGSYPYTFDLRNSILYKGKASVVNGKFSFSFIVPKDIAYKYGYGKISYYGHTNSTDASGFFDNIIVGGYESNAVSDMDGPEIDIFLNDENFVFGGVTDESPVLLAFIVDSSGINTVGTGIGHDIVVVLDANTDKSINLNDYYEADLDSYKSGVIKYPFSALSDGTHSLSLKVWDVQNNSSQAYTEFVVAESAELAIDHVLNYPNPFTTHTEFYFDHNQPNSTLEILLQVFTVSGKLVYTYNDIIPTSGFRTGPIPPHGWDGTDDYGDRLARGVYLYKVKVRTMDGSYADKLEKLVILR
ncbi:MAG: type IX secretion system sortase PorU [Bacteroidota bacterium]|nr:type IX secretion system sortase PorU [Bacteroidota bacterium]